MSARGFQQTLKQQLSIPFGNTVVIEWPISQGAVDRFEAKETLYSPRVDVAVFTAGMKPGNHRGEIIDFWNAKAPEKLKRHFQNEPGNPNPRCALAIEVTFSGSTKHILGDITNASMMGLFGVVIPSAEMEPKVRRIFEYVKAIRDVGKAPGNLFRNVRIVAQAEFIPLIS